MYQVRKVTPNQKYVITSLVFSSSHKSYFTAGLLSVGSDLPADAASPCGHPGLPLGSELVAAASETETGLWLPGQRVSYACSPGWLELGPESGDTRECLGGAWSALSLSCGESLSPEVSTQQFSFSEENLALNQPSLQSGTFLDSYSHLAVDGGIPD